MSDEVEKLREAVAKEYGITLYRQYEEKLVPRFIRRDLSTLKRWRKKGLVPYVDMGERGKFYFGYQIVDILTKGIKE